MREKLYPSLDELLSMIGDAGKRMSEINACEGTGGNISVCVRWEIDVSTLFPIVEKVRLPQPVPGLAGAVMIVSGSGQRLREIYTQPTKYLACLVIDKNGETADQFTSPQRAFQRVSSEFNSHLAVHSDRVYSTDTDFLSVIHVHPPYLTFLSQISRYQDFKYLNTHLLRWQPEVIVNLPKGIGFSPFILPGSKELTLANTELFNTHQVVVWAKHGVMACSEISIKQTVDYIEYAESCAHTEYLNLGLGEIGEGLSVENIRAICTAFNIKQDIF
jgi:rhamnulose-1-phosphate aldolase